MSVVLATLCLNEMEWLPRLYEQHKRWPELKAWIFVEAADRVYAETNRDLISSDYLSIDGTTEFLQDLAKNDCRVIHVPFGLSNHESDELCKIPARAKSLYLAGEFEPEFFIVLDADEFYTFDDQSRLLKCMREHPEFDAYIFPKREMWRSPSVQHIPLFTYEAVGSVFWDMPCCHWWRWSHGVGYYDCHNSPQHKNGSYLNRNSARWNIKGYPQMFHMGFSSTQVKRAAKNRYYENRGERVDPRRNKYTKCRRAWETWRPGESLPFGGSVIAYEGPIPEVFRDREERSSVS